jgi:hypothetical protein
MQDAFTCEEMYFFVDLENSALHMMLYGSCSFLGRKCRHNNNYPRFIYAHLLTLITRDPIHLVLKLCETMYI